MQGINLSEAGKYKFLPTSRSKYVGDLRNFCPRNIFDATLKKNKLYRDYYAYNRQPIITEDDAVNTRKISNAEYMELIKAHDTRKRSCDEKRRTHKHNKKTAFVNLCQSMPFSWNSGEFRNKYLVDTVRFSETTNNDSSHDKIFQRGEEPDFVSSMSPTENPPIKTSQPQSNPGKRIDLSKKYPTLSKAKVQVQEIRPYLNLVKAPIIVQSLIVPSTQKESTTQTSTQPGSKFDVVKTNVIADIKPSPTTLQQSCTIQVKNSSKSDAEPIIPLGTIGGLYRFPDNKIYTRKRYPLPVELQNSSAFEVSMWEKQISDVESAMTAALEKYDTSWIYTRMKTKYDKFKVIRIKLYCEMNAIIDWQHSCFRELVGPENSSNRRITLTLQACRSNKSFDRITSSTTKWITRSFKKTGQNSERHYGLELRTDDDYPDFADLQLDEETTDHLLRNTWPSDTETDSSPEIVVEACW